MERQTSYAKLRPPEPTPDEELCRCLDTPPIKLMHALTRNPLHCMHCNLEVPAETLALSQHIVEEMSAWNDIYHAIYVLWLDSGAYEAWARERLAALTSAVNARGRDVQRELNAIRRCYYWHFQDQSADDYRPLRSCLRRRAAGLYSRDLLTARMRPRQYCNGGRVILPRFPPLSFI